MGREKKDVDMSKLWLSLGGSMKRIKRRRRIGSTKRRKRSRLQWVVRSMKE
jgi:hypothetical protein